MDSWECTVCGYVYDPNVKESEDNDLSDVPFDELDDEWKCPVCGADKEDFNKFEE